MNPDSVPLGGAAVSAGSGGIEPAPERSAPPPARTLVLVGLMGAGKTAIGRRLATRLALPFIDADHEIEQAAGCSISQFFERYGETAFREGECKVIARLMAGPVHILATGGGAFMHPKTRALIRAKAVSVWLRAELDILVARTARRTTRPLLAQGDPREILEKLIATRYPVYAEADVIVDSEDVPADLTADRVLTAVQAYLKAPGAPVR